jgi:HEAT repeat protein
MTTVDAGATENLIRALRDRDLEVRCRAAEQAGTRCVRAAVPTLVELLYTTGPGSKRLITAAARALGEIGDLRAMQHLGEAGSAHSLQ